MFPLDRFGQSDRHEGNIVGMRRSFHSANFEVKDCAVMSLDNIYTGPIDELSSCAQKTSTLAAKNGHSRRTTSTGGKSQQAVRKPCACAEIQPSCSS